MGNPNRVSAAAGKLAEADKDRIKSLEKIVREQQLRIDAVPLAAELAANGEFDVEIAARYPLAEAADAHRQSEAGGLRGKIILVP